jgi:hypothetical protein
MNPKQDDEKSYTKSTIPNDTKVEPFKDDPETNLAKTEKIKDEFNFNPLQQRPNSLYLYI